MHTIDPDKLPEHVAIIMDGNGRWAKKRGWKRFKGHQTGARSVRNIVRVCRELGISFLTLYAFSEENWNRSQAEINALMNLLVVFLHKELDEMQETGIRLNCIGRVEKLPSDAREVLLDTIEKTRSNDKMVLTLAISYGGRQEIVDMVKKIVDRLHHDSKDIDISEDLISKHLYTADMPDPDLLIRTGGECRISNFLLWQLAYTEIFFTKTLWPDFTESDFIMAIKDFQKRERRFGRA